VTTPGWNEYTYYMRGWSDGAGRKPIQQDHSEHATLGAIYNEAYAAGQRAGREVAVSMSRRFNYKPAVIRTPTIPGVRAIAEEACGMGGACVWADRQAQDGTPGLFCTRCVKGYEDRFGREHRVDVLAVDEVRAQIGMAEEKP
jgi:hypothetical protein